MDKYNGLLSEVAQRYSIHKGKRETDAEWKVRLIYSICGMMAYASLWDDADDGPISILHLKKKIRSILVSYRSMYLELARSLPLDLTELEDEISNLFISAGVVYHSPYRIAPSTKCEVTSGGISFQRGISIDSISCVSGIGYYSKQADSRDIEKVKTMFGLALEKLDVLWNSVLSTASWETNNRFEQGVEYLRLKPPFSQGYWVNKPDITGNISILRTGMRGMQIYYLYRYVGSELKVSPLPQWQVESYNYRTLASACLSVCGTLPPIEYAEDGALVHLRLNYLLPPRELAFLKLYSWPETCTTLPFDFKRKMSKEVFEEIKQILSDEGYEIKKG